MGRSFLSNIDAMTGGPEIVTSCTNLEKRRTLEIRSFAVLFLFETGYHYVALANLDSV